MGQLSSDSDFQKLSKIPGCGDLAIVDPKIVTASPLDQYISTRKNGHIKKKHAMIKTTDSPWPLSNSLFLHAQLQLRFNEIKLFIPFFLDFKFQTCNIKSLI